MIAPSGEQFELSFGDQRAVVVEVGGGLRSYAVGGRDVLDGYGADAMSTSGRGQLLMPWPNRVEDGSYEFDGTRQQLPLTEPERGNAIHGLVRWASWSAAGREPDRVALRPYSARKARECGYPGCGFRTCSSPTRSGSRAAADQDAQRTRPWIALRWSGSFSGS